MSKSQRGSANSSAHGFDATALNDSLAWLDRCPPHLLPRLMGLSEGDLAQRAHGLAAWHDALLAGELPEAAGPWPPPVVAAPVLAALRELRVARFCRGQEQLTDELLSDLLTALESGELTLQREIAAELAALEQQERARQEESRGKNKPRRKRSAQINASQSTKLSKVILTRLRRRALRTVTNRARPATPALLDAWRERAAAWAQLAEVFDDLSALLGRGWDLSQGLLQHLGWSDLVRLRKWIAELPELRAIIQSLGQLRDSDADEETVSETLFEPVLRLEEELREVHVPHLPAETRGLRRGADLARMLPSEAAILGHPQLKMLWHARRAERALLCYEVAGTAIERELVEREHLEARERKRPRPERGPIMVVVDTSGSMHGAPERVAKALALEAATTAHREGRACYLYAFSGPEQVLEHELSLDAEGIGALLSFLSSTFQGGTDPDGALSRALARLEERAWRKADVILISDGEWHTGAKVEAAIARVRDEGTRLHGVRVGGHDGDAMSRLCDPMHRFSRWTDLAGW